MNMLQERKALLDACKGLAESAKSAGRDLTAAELRTVDEKLDRVKALDITIHRAKEGVGVLDRIGQLGPQNAGRDNGLEGKSFLDFSRAGLAKMAETIGRKMAGQSDNSGELFGIGAKALISPAGSVLTPVPVLPSQWMAQDRPAQNLLTLIPAVIVPAGSRATYVVEGNRVNNAGPVQPGEIKPTSTFGLTVGTVDLTVYAALSEPIDRFLMEDAAQLGTFIATGLLADVQEKVEHDIIDGTTAAGGIEGLLELAGTGSQAYTVDLLTTTRMALAQLQARYSSTADALFVLSVNDWATLQTTKAETSGTFVFPGAPVDVPLQQLWGVPVVIEAGIADGTALLFLRSKTAIYLDQQGLRVDWGNPGDTFNRNQLVARAEMRVDLACFDVKAVIEIATAADAPPEAAKAKAAAK